ncbi:alanine and proline-rich secreted protein Apa [Streptomyces cellulosae]|nr:alanine and proline-rich secreted protein Apa [Streptomyces cellulosae]
MYGHGAPPPPPSSGSVITQRVLYAASGVLCCGMLTAVPLFRVAVLRGRVFDWIAAWVSIPLVVGCIAVIGSYPEEDWRTDAGLAVMLLMGACASAYYLTVDIRLPRRQNPYGGPVPPSPHATTVHAPNGPAPYGYPQPASPYTPTALSQPQSPHTPYPGPVPPSTAPHTPVPPPQAQPPQGPAPARIDQVRAELDELSDYLRRQDGQQRPGDHEGGR